MWRRLAPGVLFFCILGCVDRPAADASGAEIYKAVCARCHDDDLSGGIGPALGGNSNAALQDDAFLRLTISDGRGRMPSFQNTLSEEQIVRVIEYLRSEQE
ncbi:hypothetical protein BH18ACT5_BH18ACT5_14890 [soil metagenome]